MAANPLRRLAAEEQYILPRFILPAIQFKYNSMGLGVTSIKQKEAYIVELPFEDVH